MPAVTKPAHKKGDYSRRLRGKGIRGREGGTGREGAGHLPHRRLRRLDRAGQYPAGDAAAAQGLRDHGAALRARRHPRRPARLPKLGDEAFPGPQNFNNQIDQVHEEGGKVYPCRFALQALYGHGEPSLIPGIRPISPLDVLDLILLHRRDNAFILEHLDALRIGSRRSAEDSRMAEKASVRVAAVQIAPDLETCGGHCLEGARRHRRGGRKGRAARCLPRDLRALVSVFLLRAPAGADRRRSICGFTRMRWWCRGR